MLLPIFIITLGCCRSVITYRCMLWSSNPVNISIKITHKIQWKRNHSCIIQINRSLLKTLKVNKSPTATIGGYKQNKHLGMALITHTGFLSKQGLYLHSVKKMRIVSGLSVSNLSYYLVFITNNIKTDIWTECCTGTISA